MLLLGGLENVHPAEAGEEEDDRPGEIKSRLGHFSGRQVAVLVSFQQVELSKRTKLSLQHQHRKGGLERERESGRDLLRG